MNTLAHACTPTHIDATVCREALEAAHSRKHAHVRTHKYCRVALEVAEYYRRLHRDVYVIDLDYKLHDCLRFAYKGITLNPKP